MIKKIVYNICRMCPAQCPVQVEVENEESRFVMGNLYASGLMVRYVLAAQVPSP